MKILRSLLALSAVFTVVGCTPNQDTEIPTVELPTLQATAVVEVTDTVAPPTVTSEITTTLEITVTGTPIPPTPTHEVMPTTTAEPTSTSTPTYTLTSPLGGQIAFLFDPDQPPWDFTDFPPETPATFNLYLATPGESPDGWQIEAIIMDILGFSSLVASPDNTQLALILLEDTDGDGLIEGGGPEPDITNIYIASLVDRTINRLTDNQKSTYTVSWSPDGQTISYRQEGTVFEASLDGSAPQLLVSLASLCTDFCSVERIAWSPDGRLLGINAIIGRGASGLYIFNRDTGEINLVGTERYSEMDWSPNGRWLAFSSGASFLVDTETLARIELVRGDFVTMPAWSPDSHSLAFIRNDQSLSLWNSNSLTIVELLNATDVGAPVWSPDGSDLAVGFQQDGQAKLAIIRSSDGYFEELLQQTEMQSIEVLSWSPDGQWLVFSAKQGEQSGIYIVDRTSAQVLLIMDTTGGNGPYGLTWLP